MSDAGVKGSQAGTTLRGALSRISKPTKAMRETMDELGISFYDSEGNMISLQEQIGVLSNSFEGMTQEQKNQALVTLYGQESLSGMMALIDKGPDSLGSLTKSLEESDGAADEMARTMQDNMNSSIEQMMGALESAAIVIQDILAPAISAVADYIGGLAEKFVSAPKWTQSAIITFGFTDFFETIREIAIVLGDGIKSAITNVWVEITTIATNTWNTIKQFFVDTWESIKQGTIDAWNGLKAWLAETWENMKQGAVDVWNSVKQFFVDLWESTKTNTINMWNAIKDGVANAWENTKTAVINTAKGIVDGAKQAWEDLKQGVSNAIEKVKETFNQIKEIDLLQIGKDIIDGLVNGIKGKIEDVKNAVKDIAGSITGKIKDILNIHSPSRVMAELGMFTSQGLADGMLDGARYVDRASSQIADRASNMDIGNRISAVNSQIQTQVQHEVSYGTNSKPAMFNIQLGNQVFQAFVDDISQAQGSETSIRLLF